MEERRSEDHAKGAGAGVFETTQWSVVLQAGQDSTAEAQVALERLCRAYRYPLYVHVRRRGWSPEDSEDLTHQFLARFIARKYLQKADPERGRFRSFLLTSLKRFLADEWDRVRTQKRGGGEPALSWDGVDPEERYRMEPVDPAATPDELYDRHWAGTLLLGVMARMRVEYETAGKLALFDQLKAMEWGERAPGAYAEVGAVLGMQEGAVKVAAHRLRVRIREEIRRAVLSTVSSPDEVEGELGYLRSLLSR